VIARQAALVTEFDVNGLKVLVKRRAGSQTVATGLFFRGGSRNLATANAGVESLMLDLATQASAAFPRERLRSELARTGTVIGSSENYDYSVLSFTATRAHFDSMWNIFTDVALHPAFTKEDFDLVKTRAVTALADDVDDPDSYLQRLQEKSAYAGHPYLNRPEGTVESLSRLTLDDVRRYRQWRLRACCWWSSAIWRKPVKAYQRHSENCHAEIISRPASTTFSASTVDITQRGLPISR
jgi:predicted Zn-dependent peptidase